MVLVGRWLQSPDGVTRPMIQVEVAGLDGTTVEDAFLVDVGADRTVLSAHFNTNLRLPGRSPDAGMKLEGISGECAFVWVETALIFTRNDGGTIRVKGEVAAFTDPAATDFSILGRDVLNNFDVIVSRLRNEVLLLSGNHRYQVIHS